MKRLTGILLSILLLLSSLSLPARAEVKLHHLLCYTPYNPHGILCTVLISDNHVYMDPYTASAITGYEVVETLPDSAVFTSGGRRVTHKGSSVSDSGLYWYRIESLMASLNTKVTASGGHLFFNPANKALNALDDAMAEYEKMIIGADPDDFSTAVGLFFARIYNLATTFDFASLFGNRYEREHYRIAFYDILRRSSDKYSTTMGELCGELEDEVISPLSTFYSQMDETFSSEVMEAFYSGSDLEELREFIDGYKAFSDVLTMSPAELYKTMEEAAFVNGAFDAGAKGLEYLLKHPAQDNQEEVLLDVMRQVLGTYHKNTSDQLQSIVFDTLVDIGADHFSQALRDAMLGKAGQLLVSSVDKAMKMLPGVSAMDELEMVAVYFRIQEIARQQIETAYRTDDYIRLKYAGIIYYRCAYLAAAEIAQMDDSLRESARDLMAKLSALEADLLAVSDHQILQQGCVNSEIHAWALIGPYKEYLAFYESLVAQYGELDEKDYYGTSYIEEGSGIIAPWLSLVGSRTFLVVIRQESSQLIQMVYEDVTGNADFVLIDERGVLTCGISGSTYQAFDRAGALLACTSMDATITSYAFNGVSIVSQQFTGASWADSLSEMRQDAQKQLADAFGSHTPGFEVDGSDGLFRISRSPAELRAIFTERFNSI